MAVKITLKNGRPALLLNPSEKGQKYAAELGANFSGNTGETLTKAQRAYRSGYLDARRDNAKAYKYNKKKRSAARKKKKT